MKRRPLMIAGGVFGLLLFCALFFWGLANTQSFMTSMGQMAGEKGSELLGSRVEVGEVRVDSPWSLTVRDIALYEELKFHLCVLDEAQFIKNQKAAAA